MKTSKVSVSMSAITLRAAILATQVLRPSTKAKMRSIPAIHSAAAPDANCIRGLLPLSCRFRP